MHYLLYFKEENGEGKVKVDTSKQLIRGLPKVRKMGYKAIGVEKVYETGRSLDVTDKYKVYF